MDKPRIWALVPAAGSGTRFGSETPKQYCEIADKPILSYALETLASIGKIHGIVVGLAKGDRWWSEKIAGSYNILGTYTGGCSRAETVLRGLEFLGPHSQTDDWVLVHDAARPCIQASDVEHLIKERGSLSSGAILAVPISDTVKRSNGKNLVKETVSRETLWHAQTPQLFPFEVLRNALRESDLSLVTDEASVMEAMGYRPRLVRGRVDNLKVTTVEDLELAALILRARIREGIG